MQTADNAKAQLLLEDRRRLLEHVIHVFQSHGGRLQLPIGMAVAEPWLLDSVDVAALLRALSAAGASTPGAPIELLSYCQRGARTVTSDNKATHSRGSSRRTSDAAGCDAPRLQLPQLHTGLTDAEVKDLAFLVLACNCPHEADLLDSVRSQLDIDEVRATEVQRLLGLVASAMRQQAGPLAVSKSWTANLELPLSMLGVVLPRDFSRFRSFVTWRDTLSHVLLATLAQSVKEGWCHEALQPQRQPGAGAVAAAPQQLQLQPQGSGGGTAQQLMARLKAALRRLDVRDADEFDEEEYRAASEAVRQQTHAIVQCVPAGCAFPWGLRVRLYEMLLRALFDSLDEAEYVPDKERYLQVLETHIRPLLGIAPAMHTAVLVWVHFRQYAITQAPQLLAETRGLLYKLAAIAADPGASGGQEAGVKAAAAAAAFGAVAAVAAAASSQQAAESAAAAANGSADGGYRKQDAAFARNVGQSVVDWILERLSDYHSRLDALGGPESIPGLVDLLAFASSCRGASEEEVGRALLESVSLSTAAELQRRMDAAAAAAAGDAADEAGDQGSEAGRCADVCRTVKQLIADEPKWTRGFASQLPEAYAVSLAVLQEAAGAVLMPWLSTQPVLDDSTCEALRCALDLEPRLMGPIRSAAAGSCRYACTARLFASVRPWNTPGQLQPLLSAWLDKQMSGFVVWVDRQLQQEDWKPLGLDQFHSASARELRRIAMESLEALFGLQLQLPLPASTVRQYMQGIAGMMTRYLDAILTALGSETVMIPPVPPLTRYKREVAVKQEEAESQLPGMPSEQPPPGAVSRKGVRFVDSVRRVEDEPCASRVGGLTTPVLVVMLASLAYLAQTLQLLATSVKQMRQQEQQARLSGSGSPAPLDPLEDFSSGTAAGPEANPFLSDAEDAVGSFWDPGDGQGGGYRGSSSAGGAGNSSSPAWGSRKPPLQQQQRQLAGTRWQASGCSMGPGGSRGGGSSGEHDEQFGSLHETGQRLRVGLASVARWLAVRVVWWQQRSGWCELLYRHRVTSQRVGWLLDGLADTLQDNVSALAPSPEDPPTQQTAAQELYSSVALELLQQAAKAMERTLLDGGPCRWFIPADVEHLADDVDELKKLFFRAKVPMQDIRTALLGLEGILRLMRQQTGPLIEAHKRARRAALLAAPAAPASPPPPSSSSSAAAAAAAAGAFSGWGQGLAAAGGPSSGSSSSYHTRSPSQAAAVTTSAASSSSTLPPSLGPLAAAKLANAAQGSPTAAGAAGRASDRGSGGGFAVGHHSRQPTGGGTSGSTFDYAASYSSAGGGGSPSWASSKVVGSGAASPAATGAAGAAAAGAAGVLGGIGCMRRTAQDVAAAGGDVEAQEPILLRVLCHRADHAASKYLKESMKVSKARDEGSVKETLKRGVTRFNPF